MPDCFARSLTLQPSNACRFASRFERSIADRFVRWKSTSNWIPSKSESLGISSSTTQSANSSPSNLSARALRCPSRISPLLCVMSGTSWPNRLRLSVSPAVTASSTGWRIQRGLFLSVATLTFSLLRMARSVCHFDDASIPLQMGETHRSRCSRSSAGSAGSATDVVLRSAPPYARCPLFGRNTLDNRDIRYRAFTAKFCEHMATGNPNEWPTFDRLAEWFVNSPRGQSFKNARYSKMKKGLSDKEEYFHDLIRMLVTR